MNQNKIKNYNKIMSQNKIKNNYSWEPFLGGQVTLHVKTAIYNGTLETFIWSRYKKMSFFMVLNFGNSYMFSCSRNAQSSYGYRLASGIAIYTWWVIQSLQLEINNSYHLQTISIFLYKILFSFLSSKSLRYWDFFGRSLHTLFFNEIWI